MQPVRSMLWEFWRGQRLNVALTAAAVLALAGAAQAVSETDAQDWLRPLAHVLMAVSLLGIFAGFTFTETHRQLKLAVFPVRLFSLPIATSTLVLVPMLTGAVSVALVYAAWVGFVFHPLGHAQPLVEPALLLATGLIAYQAVMWSLAQYRLWRLVFCGLIGGLLVWLLVLPESVLPRALTGGAEGLRVVKLAGLLACVNAGFVAWVWRSIARQRHVPTTGEPQSSAKSVRFSGVAGQPVRAFRSPHHAQFWLEWRRNGWLLPGLAGFVALLLAYPVPWMIELGAPGAVRFAVGCALAPIALAVLVGKGLAVPDFWTRDLSLPSFIAIRPLSCGEWVFVRVRLAAVSAGVSCVLLGLALAIALTLTGSWDGLLAALNQTPAGFAPRSPWLLAGGASLLVGLLTWRYLVVSLHTGLLGRQWPFVLATIGSLVLLFFLLPWWLSDNWLELTPYNPEFHWHPLVWLLSLGWAGKLLLALWAWNEAYRRGLVSGRELGRYFGFWLLTVLALTGLVLFGLPADSWLRQVAALAVGLLVPLGRIGLAPLAFALNRHRRISTAPRDNSGRLVKLSLRLSWPARPAPALSAFILAASLGVALAAREVLRVVPQLVAVNGQEFRVLVCGHGAATIVLEGDMEAMLREWAPIQQVLARDATVFVYERPGIGGSPAAMGLRTLAQNAADLRELLRGRGLDDPVLLVGAHIGAAYARAFAAIFPQQVAGLVLLDPTDDETSAEILLELRRGHPELSGRMDSCLKEIGAIYRPYAIRELRLIERELGASGFADLEGVRKMRWEDLRSDKVYMKTYQYTRADAGSQAEFARLDELIVEDRSHRLPDRPITVLTGTKLSEGNMLEREGMQSWRLDAKLASRSAWLAKHPHATHVIVPDAGDDLIGNGPDIVVQHVRALLEKLVVSGRSGAAPVATGVPPRP